MTSEPIALVSCGPQEHGISRFARSLADGVVRQGFQGVVLHEPDPRRLPVIAEHLPPGTRLVHLQCNDWLFADAVHPAEETICRLAARLRSQGAVLSLTLHDLPQQGVPPALFRRRARTYLTMAAAAAGVVVSSHHERLLLTEAADSDERGPQPDRPPSITVIPLPVPEQPALAGGGMDDRPLTGVPTIGLLGYVYPGKGHHEVLTELAGLGSTIAVTAIGRPSDGHDLLLTELVKFADSKGIELTCTGYVADSDLGRHLRDVTVPVASHPQVSASASINSWIAAGRRPLVVDGRYTRELDTRMPGSVVLYTSGELRRRVEAALEDPTLTYLPAGFSPRPRTDEVAAAYLRWLRSVARTESA